MKKKLSIVIAAWNEIDYLCKCLISLEKQIEISEIEVISVANFSIEELKSKPRFAFVKFLEVEKTTTVPQLRKHGIDLAKGEIVALAEDHCLFDENWCLDVLQAHQTDYFAIGGVIENLDNSSNLDWAVYFYDYGKYMPPNQDGESETLSGFNISYKKSVLEDFRENYREGFFETFFNEEIKQNGYKLYLTNSAKIYHSKTYGLKRTIIQFYHLARSFAAIRALNASFVKRLIFTSFALVLPILLPTRIAMTIFKKNRRIYKLVQSFPFIILLMTVWSFGEFCGYLGGAGKSTGKWN